MSTEKDAAFIAFSWLAGLDAAFASGDACALTALFQPLGWLRDLLAFGWQLRTLHGINNISIYLVDRLHGGRPTDFALDTRPVLKPSFVPVGSDATGIEVAFTFSVPKGNCRGIAYLLQDEAQTWKALTVMVMLDGLKGLEERANESGLYGNHTKTWQEVRQERETDIESDPDVLVLGAGQTGLQIAARFKQMGIRSLVIDKNPRIGDNWRCRYPTLTLHTPRAHHQFLYAPYPSTWPTFTPRDKLASWLEHYASSQDLSVWLSSTLLPTPSYSSITGRWTVRIQRHDLNQELTLHPAHIVLATGLLGAPRLPSIPSSSLFAGQQLHSSAFPGGAPFAGRRVVVVGSGTTGADVCQDLVHHGAARVTMVQRTPTIVHSTRYLSRFFAQYWAEGVPIDVTDLRMNAVPLRRLKEILTGMQPGAEEYDREMHEGLKKRGFQLSSGQDGAGLLWNVYARFAGHWLDVGCAELVADGHVDIKSGVEIAQLKPNSVVFTDGSEIETDVIIYATGYESMRDSMRKVFGDEMIDRTSVVWGIDEEGELRGCYKPSGQEGLWFAAGDFAHSRFFSKPLGLQIQAELLGVKEYSAVNGI